MFNVRIFVICSLFFVGTSYVPVIFAENLSHEKMANLAELGNHTAQYNIGARYYNGKNVERSLIEAYAWFSLAAESGDKRFVSTFEKVSAEIPEGEKVMAKIRSQILKKMHGMEALNMSLLPEMVEQEIQYCNLKLAKNSIPKYPRKTAMKGVQGWVDMEISVDQYGRVRDSIIVQSVPKRAFDASAVDAVTKRIYEPPTLGGESAEIIGHRFRVRYELMAPGTDGRKNSKKYQKKLDDYQRELSEKAGQGDPRYQYLYPYVMNAFLEYEGLSEIETNEWYLKSAQQGYPQAQYAIGKQLFYGNGCIADYAKAVDWLTISAKNNYPYAQTFLARILYKNDEEGKLLDKVMFWLDKAIKRDFDQAKVVMSWILVTHEDEKVRDPEKALRLVRSVEQYYDEARLFEIEAAALAIQGDFKGAVKKQKRAIKWAKRYNWFVGDMNERLISYKTGLSKG